VYEEFILGRHEAGRHNPLLVRAIFDLETAQVRAVAAHDPNGPNGYYGFVRAREHPSHSHLVVPSRGCIAGGGGITSTDAGSA
jgi:hypothetical protein